MPPTVDRSIARMIAGKRIVTGTAAIAAGIVMVILQLNHGDTPSPALGLALLIFFGGGAWTLRDGIRLRRELRATAPTAPSAQGQG